MFAPLFLSQKKCGRGFPPTSRRSLCLLRSSYVEQVFVVADIKGGGKQLTRIVPWQHRPDVIRTHGTNKFGLLGRGETFTFFINDISLMCARIARTAGARLDLAIGGITLHQRVVCLYRNFILRVLPDAGNG